MGTGSGKLRNKPRSEWVDSDNFDPATDRESDVGNTGTAGLGDAAERANAVDELADASSVLKDEARDVAIRGVGK